MLFSILSVLISLVLLGLCSRIPKLNRIQSSRVPSLYLSNEYIVGSGYKRWSQQWIFDAIVLPIRGALLVFLGKMIVSTDGWVDLFANGCQSTVSSSEGMKSIGTWPSVHTWPQMECTYRGIHRCVIGKQNIRDHPLSVVSVVTNKLTDSECLIVICV